MDMKVDSQTQLQTFLGSHRPGDQPSIDGEEGQPRPPIYTIDHRENLRDGFMICGIIGSCHETSNSHSNSAGDKPKSLFSDTATNNSHFRDSILNWFNAWGIRLHTDNHDASSFERSFFETRWLNTEGFPQDIHLNVSKSLLINNCDSLLGLLEKRQPKVVIFAGDMLFDAFMDNEIQRRLHPFLGDRTSAVDTFYDKGSIVQSSSYSVSSVKYRETRIISLPDPSSVELTERQARDLKPPLYVLHDLFEKMFAARNPST